MCIPDLPEPKSPAASPAAPKPVAQVARMNERVEGGPNAPVGRKALRTDVNVSGGVGANLPRMGGG